MEILTLQRLKDMEPNTVFARGSYLGVGVTSEGKWVNWVACRGGIHDWAIYSQKSSSPITTEQEWIYIQRQGDKVHSMSTVAELVTCTEEALAWYRH